MSLEAETVGYGSDLFGNRPSFALTRRLDDTPTLELIELLPEEMADGREKRFQRVSSHRSFERTPIEKAIPAAESETSTGSIEFDTDDVVTSTQSSPNDWSWDQWWALPITTLSGERSSAVTHLIQRVLEEEGVEPAAVLNGTGTALLSEVSGVRLALAFVGIHRLQRHDKMRHLANGVNQMSLEECYYWYAKCRSPDSPNGVKALRVLLTEHIN